MARMPLTHLQNHENIGLMKHVEQEVGVEDPECRHAGVADAAVRLAEGQLGSVLVAGIVGIDVVDDDVSTVERRYSFESKWL